ncbi:hypothetical protein VTG60DRAFT_5025 [Thermothelomyces hinnuleus]
MVKGIHRARRREQKGAYKVRRRGDRSRFKLDLQFALLKKLMRESVVYPSMRADGMRVKSTVPTHTVEIWIPGSLARAPPPNRRFPQRASADMDGRLYPREPMAGLAGSQVLPLRQTRWAVETKIPCGRIEVSHQCRSCNMLVYENSSIHGVLSSSITPACLSTLSPVTL